MMRKKVEVCGIVGFVGNEAEQTLKGSGEKFCMYVLLTLQFLALPKTIVQLPNSLKRREGFCSQLLPGLKQPSYYKQK